MRKVVPCAPTDLPPPSRKCYPLVKRGLNPSPSGEAQLCCVLLLSLETTYEKILTQWAQICTVILEGRTSKPTESSAASHAPQRGTCAKTNSGDHDSETNLSNRTSHSDDAASGVLVDRQDAFRLIACRLVCVREALAVQICVF